MIVETSVLRRLVARASALPSLRDRYADLPPDLAGVDLLDLPVLTKEDFRAAFGDLLTRARTEAGGALVFGSGGTTAAPKLSLIPSGMFIADILRHWRPLAPGDVLANLNNAGELGSMYPFYNMLGHQSGAVVVPLGAVDPQQYGIWLDFLEHRGVTAAGATPSQLVRLLEYCESAGRRPPPLRKLVWTGEPYGSHAAEVTGRMLPDAARYGVYGSTETWVIGHNGPVCPLDTFHLLPYQHIEIVDGAVLVTNTHPDGLNPILRYRIGDRGQLGVCPCGRPGNALRVLGRDDHQLKFRTILVIPEEIAEVAQADPNVRAVQLALFEAGDPAERLELRLLTAPGADPTEAERRVRRSVLDQLYRIGFELGDMPGAFTVRAVDRLYVQHRTNKTPLLVHDPEGSNR